MAAPPYDDPPAYRQEANDPDEIVQPAVLILDGQFIYSESIRSSPLYELSRVIHAQSATTTEIDFQRLEYRSKTLADGSPSIAKRERQLYKLQRVPFFNQVRHESECYMKALSNKGIGTVGFKKAPFPHSGLRAARILSESQKKDSNLKRRFIFALKENGSVFEWTDSNGRLVATQTRDDTGRHMLLVALPLSRRLLDSLVALWCVWLWQLHLDYLGEGQGKKWEWNNGKLISVASHPSPSFMN